MYALIWSYTVIIPHFQIKFMKYMDRAKLKPQNFRNYKLLRPLRLYVLNSEINIRGSMLILKQCALTEYCRYIVTTR